MKSLKFNCSKKMEHLYKAMTQSAQSLFMTRTSLAELALKRLLSTSDARIGFALLLLYARTEVMVKFHARSTLSAMSKAFQVR